MRRAHEPWRGHWDIPGGFCGAEHPRDAAAREVREETGLVVRVGPVLGMWMDTYAPEGPEADKVTLNIYFHATVDGPAEAVTDPNEVAEIGWFAPDALPARARVPRPRAGGSARVARELRGRLARRREGGRLRQAAQPERIA